MSAHDMPIDNDNLNMARFLTRYFGSAIYRIFSMSMLWICLTLYLCYFIHETSLARNLADASLLQCGDAIQINHHLIHNV